MPRLGLCGRAASADCEQIWTTSSLRARAKLKASRGLIRTGGKLKGLLGQPEAGLVVLQRGALLVAQEIQVSDDGAPRDAELAHEVPAVGQVAGFRALAHHLDPAPDVERILTTSRSGKRGCACIPAPTRRAKRPPIRGSTTPSPNYDTEPVVAFPPPKRPVAPKCASLTACSAAPSPPAAAFSGCKRAPATRKGPCLTSGPTFVTLRPWKRTLSASDSGPTPRRAKSDFPISKAISYQWARRP